MVVGPVVVLAETGVVEWLWCEVQFGVAEEAVVLGEAHLAPDDSAVDCLLLLAGVSMGDDYECE